MDHDFRQLKCFQPDGNVPPTPVACQPFDQSHIVIVYEDRSCALMEIDQNNDPNVIDELGAINGYVSALVATSGNSFITGSQDCTFRGWEIQDEQFMGEFNLLTEAPVKCVSINEDQSQLAVGMANGNLGLYTATYPEDRSSGWELHSVIECHNSEVLCLSWKENYLATGGRDRFVHVIEIDPDNKSHPARSTVPLKMHTSTVNAVHWMTDEHGTCRLITGGADKALYFMMKTSETNYEREKWVQINWPIHDIKGRLNAYVATGKYIQSYNVNGELLKEFAFEKASKVTSVALNEQETLVAGCSNTSIHVFDITTSSILQTISVSSLSVALIGDYVITGDQEGTLVCWQLRTQQLDSSKRTLSRQSMLPMPPPMIKPTRRETMPPNGFSDVNESKMRRRTAWNACPTPFKIKSLDTSAVTIFDDDEDDMDDNVEDCEETYDTVRENSLYEIKDETVKEADGSSSTQSSGIGSKNSELEKDETKKSSNFDEDSLNASVDDADALFGESKAESDKKLEEVFAEMDVGRESLSSNAIKRFSDQRFTPELCSPPIIHEEDEAEEDAEAAVERHFQRILENTEQNLKEKLEATSRIAASLAKLQSRLLTSL